MALYIKAVNNNRNSCIPGNMLDMVRKHLGYGQLWPSRSARSQNQAVHYMPDPTFRIQFGSIFPKKAQTILCKTGPEPIWMAWSVSGRTKPACYQFPTFILSCALPPYCAKPPGSDLVLADCVRFWPGVSGPEARIAGILSEPEHPDNLT